MRYLFRNAKIVDGSGQKAFSGEVLVERGRIKQIFSARLSDEKALAVAGGGERIDLEGKVLCPGFIDCHSHNDWFCLKSGRERYFDPLLAQGITTIVTGNCGFSASGFDADSPFLEALGGELFQLPAKERIPRCADWLEAVRGQVPLNVGILLGHGTARLSAAGLMQADLTPSQEQNMLRVLEEGLQQGALGISLGLMYAPGLFAAAPELEKVARLCARYDRILTVHPRAESTVSLSYPLLGRSHLLRALDELAALVRNCGCRFEYSHLIFVGRKSWGDLEEALAILEKLNAEGYRSGFDLYPYDFGASVITVILPDWYQKMSRQERQSPWIKAKLRFLVAVTSRMLGFDFDDMKLAYAGERHPEYEGRRIGEIARSEKRNPFDVYLQICEDSHFKARVLMGAYQNERSLDRLMRHPLSVYMTDAWYEEAGVQNDSLYHAFPRFLRLAREKNIPMEDCIHKMSGKTAERFQIPERGFLREGFMADLLVLDPDKISDSPSIEEAPEGLTAVYVNGVKVYDGRRGKFLEGRERAGRSIVWGTR